MYCRVCNQFFSSLHNKKEHLFGKQHLSQLTGEFEREAEQNANGGNDKVVHDVTPAVSVADTVHVGHNPVLIPPDTEPMLSISQFTEKFLEQNMSKFLYHIEVIVRCRRGSVLSLLFTHFIVFTSFPPWSSPLTLFLSSSFRFHSLFQARFVSFSLLGSLSFSSFHLIYSPWYFLPLPPFFFLPFFPSFLSPPIHFPSLTPCFPFLHSPSAPPPFATPLPTPILILHIFSPPFASCCQPTTNLDYSLPSGKYFENV